MLAARVVSVLALAVAFAAVPLSLAAVPAVAAAPDVTFEVPTASSALGQSLTFGVRFTSPVKPTRVELLRHVPTDAANQSDFVEEALVATDGTGYTATIVDQGHTLPNTTLLYRFRVTTPDGAAVSDEQRFTVVDDRITWRVKEGALIRLHWSEGDAAFADRALKVGEDGLGRASALLGVTENDPVDFFVYANETQFREALGPGTSENIGGRAVPSIRTLFALIRPAEIGSDWIDHVVPHELTHLVFDTASGNPYHFPPKWLNEGLAVYMEPGAYSADWRAQVEVAAKGSRLMPLDALTLTFPSERQAFSLGYAESVAAVDFFVRKFGQDTLVKLIRSYAAGVSDDDAFRTATGGDIGAFNDGWVAELGGGVAPAAGPQPAPPGPVPTDWTAPSSAPSPSATPVGTPGPTPSSGASSTAVPPSAPVTSGGSSVGPTATGGIASGATPGEPSPTESNPPPTSTTVAANPGGASPGVTPAAAGGGTDNGRLLLLVLGVGVVGMVLLIAGLLLMRRRPGPPAPPPPVG